MNSLRNKVTLIGNLGNNPEIKTFENNKKMARMSIATNEIYKNKKGEKIIETTWHNVIVWGGLVSVSEQFLKKGTEVCVEGKLVNRNWTDKEGVKHYATEIHAHDLLLLGNRAA